MRLALALVLLAATASVAAAQPPEDRYGPRRAESVRLASNTGVGAYQGRMLNWSSRAFVPQTPEAPPIPALPAAVAAPIPAAAMPAPPMEAARPVAVAKPVPPPARAPVQAAPPDSLPDSLYAPPPPLQKVASLAAPATPAATGSRPRLYSVHRQYGMSPDAIPAASAGGANYVLIAPREGVGGEQSPDKGDTDDDRPF